MLFHWIPIMARLPLPSAIAIRAIWPFLAVITLIAKANGNNFMAILGFQVKSI